MLERALGGVATLLLAAVGFLLAVGHYDVGAYLWIEAFFVVATIFLGFLLFSHRARPLLKLGRPVLARVRLDTLVARVYDACTRTAITWESSSWSSSSRSACRRSASWPSGSAARRWGSTSRRGRTT